MIQANLRLVVKIARDYVGRGMPLDDLIGEGNLGLIRAAEEFDPRFGTRFSTYASYWIKQSIRHAADQHHGDDPPAGPHGQPADQVAAGRAGAQPRAAGRAPTLRRDRRPLGLTETQKTLVARARQASQLKLESGMTGEATGAGRPTRRSTVATARCDAGGRRRARQPAAPAGPAGRSRAHHPVAAIRPGRRAAADPQGDRPPAGRDPRMGPQDRAPRRPQARRPQPRAAAPPPGAPDGCPDAP